MLAALREVGLERVPVVVGGIIPPADAERLKASGVAAVYTPKDFAITGILADIVTEVEARLTRSPRPRGHRRRVRSRTPIHVIVCPPLADNVEPVMKPASSDAKNRTQRAISSGSPRRRTGI